MRRIHHHLSVRFRALACAVLAVVAVASGCSSDSGENKAGNESKAKPVELVLANHEGGSDNVGDWADAVEQLSEGSIRIRVSNNWRQGESNYEQATLGDVRNGKAELAAVAARAFDEVGVTSFQPLAAPLLIDNADLERRVLTGDVGHDALSGTEKIGLEGLALVPGYPRRPVGLERTLVSPDDYRGARIYTREGKVARATFEALGAQPAHGPLETWFEGVDGAEVHLSAVRGQAEVVRNGAGITSNVVLWPQPYAIVMNQSTFDKLSDAQQRTLREAGAEAFDARSRHVSELADEDLHALCRMGAKFVEATPSEREALAAAVEPVYRLIEKGPGNAEAVASIRELKGDGEPESVSCADADEPASNRGGAAAELEGTFRTTLTEEELAESPLLYDPGEVSDENWGEMTLRFSDGRVRVSQENKRTSYGVSGSYTTVGDVLKMEFDDLGETWGFRWSLYRGTLKLERDESLGVPPELHAPTPLLINPWERVQ